ncbi:MAG: recombinase RecA [Mycoplasma sp.]|nr:recombinase RecA [Mycoplasma sp.]
MDKKNKIDKHLIDTLNLIEKKFGKESIMLLGKSDQNKNIDTFSSGSLILNDLLGIGGFPKGRVIEMYGPESSGKTTFALQAIAEIQKQNGIAAFIDAEHSIDPIYAKNLGIDVDNLILSQPDSGEQALEIVDTLVKTNAVDLIIVDSVAALVPEAELNGEMKDQTVGAQARLMSKALRKITGSLNKTNCTIIFINQLREKVGIIFGNPEITPGGRALKFYSSIRIEVRRGKTFSTNDTNGNIVKLKVVKNKLAPPYRKGETEIEFGKGISKIHELIVIAELKGVLTRKGSWYTYNDENIAQGKAKLKELLESNSELFNELLEKIKTNEILK